MTENEAIKELNVCIGSCVHLGCDGTAMHEAIKTLNEIQQYRSIGTVSECQEAVERQRVKRPMLNDKANVMFCPICERKVKNNYDLHCSGCGKAIDWSDMP